MKHRRVAALAPACCSIGAIILGAGAPARADNLLINPGFEAPPPSTQTDQTAAGWTFVVNCERAPFQNNTPGGTRSIWAKTFHPAGGGVFQEVNITAGATYDLTSQI